MQGRRGEVKRAARAGGRVATVLLEATFELWTTGSMVPVNALFKTPVALTIEVQGYEQHVYRKALWLTVATPRRHGTESWPLNLRPSGGLRLTGKGAVRIPAMPRGTWQVTLRTDDYALTSTTVTSDGW